MNDLFCPVCEPVFKNIKPFGKRSKDLPEETIRVAERLMIVEENYSGCGVDHAVCGKCRNTFQVSYKVDEIILLEGYVP